MGKLLKLATIAFIFVLLAIFLVLTLSQIYNWIFTPSLCACSNGGGPGSGLLGTMIMADCLCYRFLGQYIIDQNLMVIIGYAAYLIYPLSILLSYLITKMFLKIAKVKI